MISINCFKINKIDYEKLNSKLVSVILCTFREKPKFELLYESLSHQTIKNFELVIADYLYETRKDFVQKLAEKFNIRTVHLPRNKYGVHAFNVGMEHSSGEYMIHINDANYFHNRFIEKHLLTCVNNYLSVGTRYFCYSMDFPIEKHLTGYIEIPPQDPTTLEFLKQQSHGIDRFLHIHFGEHIIASPQDFRLMGLPDAFFTEDNLVFEGQPGWSYGGNLAGPTELFLKINGFDEEFDKGYGWSDCNLGIRAFNSGYKLFVNPSNWTLEIQDVEHDSVYELLPNYKTQEARDHNWKLYEEACEKNLVQANPNFNLREIRQKFLDEKNK